MFKKNQIKPIKSLYYYVAFFFLAFFPVSLSLAYPPYFDELKEKGYHKLLAHLEKMQKLNTRNERKNAIENLEYSEFSEAVLEVRDAIITKVEESLRHIPNFEKKRLLFLVGGTGSGKSTGMCFLRGDKMILNDVVYDSQRNQAENSNLIGHGTTSCTFFPHIEEVKNEYSRILILDSNSALPKKIDKSVIILREKDGNMTAHWQEFSGKKSKKLSKEEKEDIVKGIPSETKEVKDVAFIQKVISICGYPQNFIIVEVPGFEDTNGELVSLGKELALVELKKFNPYFLVFESITNTNGRFVAAAQLGLRLSRLIDKANASLVTTKYSEDPHFIKMRTIEEQQMKDRLKPSLEEQLLAAQIQGLSGLNLPQFQPQIDELKSKLQEVKLRAQSSLNSPLEDTEVKIDCRKKLQEIEDELLNQIGMNKELMVRFYDLEKLGTLDSCLEAITKFAAKNQSNLWNPLLLDADFLISFFHKISEGELKIENNKLNEHLVQFFKRDMQYLDKNEALEYRIRKLSSRLLNPTSMMLDADHEKLLEYLFFKLHRELEMAVSSHVKLKNFKELTTNVLNSSLVQTVLSESMPKLEEFLNLKEMPRKIVQAYDKRMYEKALNDDLKFIINLFDITTIDSKLSKLKLKSMRADIAKLKDSMYNLRNYVLGLEGLLPENLEDANEAWTQLRQDYKKIKHSNESLPGWIFGFSWISRDAADPVGLRHLLATNKEITVQMIKDCDRDLKSMFDALFGLKEIQKLVDFHGREMMAFEEFVTLNGREFMEFVTLNKKKSMELVTQQGEAPRPFEY